MKRVSRPLDVVAVKKHRREECVHYKGCLEEASALLWPSFTCEGCQLFFPRPATDHASYERSASPLGWEI